MNEKRNVHESDIAGPKICAFAVRRREIFQQFNFVTARCFYDGKLDLGTFNARDFLRKFTFLMCCM